MDRLEVMQLFVRVAESGNFSKAARGASLSQPTVSKQIAALEASLGAQLLRRTSRGASLTEAGQRFYESSVRLLGELQAAESSIRDGEHAASGRLRVTMPAALGRIYLVPKLPEFFARHPGLKLDLDITDRHANLIEEGLDVAIRIGHLADSTLLARRIGRAQLISVASPAYLKKHGTPRTLADLEAHQSIAFLSGGAPFAVPFKGPRGPVSFVPKGPFCVNDAEHLHAAVLAGLGIAYNPSWLYARDLADGTVVQVLKKLMPAPHPIHALSPAARKVPAKVKTFVDFLAAIFAAEETLRLR